MTFLKSQKQFGQFETLEAKKLFAADLAASADVVSLDPGDCSSALTAGFKDKCPSDMVSPLVGGSGRSRFGSADSPSIVVHDVPNIVGPVDNPQLGGQEGEPVSPPASDIVLASLGGQEGEDVADPAPEYSWSILPKSGPDSHSGNSYTEIEWT